MESRKLMLLIGALVVAAVTAVMARNMISGGGAPTAAAAPVPTGPEARRRPVFSGRHDHRRRSFRSSAGPRRSRSRLITSKGEPGRTRRCSSVPSSGADTAGQPLTQGSVIKPGERGFLAAALGPGMRAVTVPVSATSGVAGFVFPGDQVDLVLTRK